VSLHVDLAVYGILPYTQESRLERKMTAKTGSRRRERLEARVHSDVKDLIARAAALQGVSISDFVVRSAHDAAKSVLHEQATMRLTERDARTFIDAIDDPPEPSEALKRAMAEYMRLHGDTE
jgi:uncharacterized protein (DUF1778 family)